MAEVTELDEPDSAAPEIEPDVEGLSRAEPEIELGGDGEEAVDAIATEVDLPDAERRQLTVLFCDLVEATHLMEQLDLEDYREVVQDFQAVCATATERFAGYVAQYHGDGLLVYFGYPSAHEDDVQRAVWVGLRIVAAVNETLNPRLQRTLGVEIAVQVGIHTGPVIVGEIRGASRRDPLAIGETPGVATRLQHLAAPNTVVISGTTARLIQGYFTLAELGSHRLTGLAAPMPLFQVLAGTGAQRRFDVEETRGVAPLVGREHEVGLLMQRWERAQEGRGQVVVLSGEAGIGKSRLVLAVKEQIATQRHYRVEWQTSPHHQQTPLYPIADFARRFLQIEPADTPADKLAKLERVIERFRLPVAESVLLVSDLLDFTVPADRFTPRTLSPQAQRRQTLDTLIMLFQELSDRHPLLFVIEDLHWADPSTLELLDLLLEQMPTASILALLTCRLEAQWSWEARSYVTQLTLDRLPRVQMVQMAALMIQDQPLPTDVLDYIVDRTDGVPLFIEEMTKAIVESGYLATRDPGGTSHGTGLGAMIPETLQDPLMSRLDRLESAKVVAQYASVIGRQFTYELLEVLLPLGVATLQHELSRLVESELIHQRGRLPQAVFTFKHALIQETAYQSLLRDTRRRLHQQIADFFEGQGDDLTAPEPELLAHHYTAAGLNDKAVSYWRLAGRLAIARSAHVEAVSHLTQGLALLETVPASPERSALELSLQTSLGTTYMATKGYAAPEVEQAYIRARALCQEPGSSSRLLQVLLGLQALYLTRGVLQTARQLGEECLALAIRQPTPPRVPHAHFALGSTLFFLGDSILARVHLEQAITLYNPEIHRTRGLNDTGVSSLILTAWTAWSLGYPDQARDRIQAAIDRAQGLSSPFSLVYALACAPFVYQNCGDPFTAQARAEAGVKLSREQEFPHWLALSTAFEGWAMAAQGQGQEGCERLQHGLQLWRATGAGQMVPCLLALLAESYGKSGWAEAGLQAVAEGFVAAEQHSQMHYLAELYRIQGELYLMQSEADETAAQASFDQALHTARIQQAKSLELRSAISISRLWQRQGQPRQAHALLSDVYGWFSEGFETGDLQAAKALLDALEDESSS